MRLRAAALIALLLMTGVAPAGATTRIADDRGGQIGPYLAKYHALRESGDLVEIDGLCASACTLLLGAIPRNRICITARAILEFHAAFNFEPSGQKAISAAGTRLLWSSYPPDVRRWIGRHGGLSSQILDLRGAELASMFRTCR